MIFGRNLRKYVSFPMSCNRNLEYLLPSTITEEEEAGLIYRTTSELLADIDDDFDLELIDIEAENKLVEAEMAKIEKDHRADTAFWE